MILADTSVWIDFFNGDETAETTQLDRALDNDTVVLGDIIFLEILQGYRYNSDFNLARKALGVLDIFEMLGSEMVLKCANNYRSLRRKGITIRKTTDLIIATFCIENRLPLLHADRNFLPFEKHLKLRVVSQET